MVSLNAGSPAAATALHLEVHKVFGASKDADGWYGSPLETALAAVALSAHGPAYREDAVRALDSTLRWWRGGHFANTSDDAAALALGALAASNLQRSIPSLVAKAGESVGRIASRKASFIPDLHLALSAWALDRLILDRASGPWPQLLGRFQIGTSGGVDTLIREYGKAVASSEFDGRLLLQRLLAAVVSAPSSSDAAVLMWILTLSIERLAPSMSEEDPEMKILLRQRTELVERLLANEPDAGAVVDEDEGAPRAKLSPLEAFLIDIALPQMDSPPFLTASEAKAWFGQKWRRERATTSVLVVALGGISATGLVLQAEEIGYSIGIAVSAGVAIASAAVFAAIRMWLPAGGSRVWRSAAVFFATLTLLGLASTVNQSLEKPFLKDFPSLVVGIVIPLLVMIISQIPRHERN
jgi:hypothetical protein